MADAIAGWSQQLDRDLRAYTELAHRLGHRIQIKLYADGTGRLGDAQVSITVAPSRAPPGLAPIT